MTRSVRARFISALLITLAGAVLLVGAFTFSPDAERWVAVGVGAGCLALLVVAFAMPGRGTPQRLLDTLLVAVCIWTLVSSRTIELAGHGATPGLVRWLSFASGAAITALGLISLLVHELSVEHDLDWAARRMIALKEQEAVEVHDYRYPGATERDVDALSRAIG